MAERMTSTASAISELVATLQTDRVPDGPETLEGLRAVLVQPERTPAPRGGTVVGWLVSLYHSGDREFQGRLRDSLVSLLEDPKRFGLRGEALALAFALAEEVPISEAEGPIRSLVESRELPALSDDVYGDLHGRALRTLLFLGKLDPLECFEQELPYRDYVPLAFAFVRDRVKDRLPEVLLQLATFDFFADALRTVVLTYPDEYMDLLRQAVRETVDRKDRERIAAFVDAVQRLPIQPTELAELLQSLHPEKKLPVVEVMVALEDEATNDQLIKELLDLEFKAKRYSRENLRWADAPWVVTTSGHLHSFLQSGIHDRAVKLLRVFRQGDTEPHGSKDEWSVVIPQFMETPKDKAAHIRERLVQIRLQQRWVERPAPQRSELQVGTPRAAPPSTLEYLNSGKASAKKKRETVGAAPSR